jgi:dTMP kinase
MPFIVFEGCDGAGKSTQLSLLNDYLLSKGKIVHNLVFPDRTTITGKIINEYLSKNKEVGEKIDNMTLHMLFSSNRYEKKTYIEKILSNKNIDEYILCDRYIYSGIAYSYATGCDYDFCKTIDKYLPKPDILIYLNLNPNISLKRGKGDEIYENNEFQNKVYENYQKILYDTEIIDNTKIININANTTINTIFNNIITEIMLS